MNAGSAGISSIASCTSCIAYPGSVGASAHAAASRPITRLAVTSVRSTTSSAPASSQSRVVGGFGEAEPIDRRDHLEQVARVLREPLGAGAGDAPLHALLDALLPHEGDPLDEVRGARPLVAVEPLQLGVPVVAAGSGRSSPADAHVSAAATARRAGPSGQTAAARSSTPVRSWRLTRKCAVGGPHSCSISRVESRSVAVVIAAAQLSASRFEPHAGALDRRR